MSRIRLLSYISNEIHFYRLKIKIVAKVNKLVFEGYTVKDFNKRLMSVSRLHATYIYMIPTECF